MNIPQEMEIGLGHFAAGRLAEAEEIGRRILAVQPEHTDALYLLAAVASRVGQSETGLRLVRRAIALSPRSEIYFNLLGILHQGRGESEQAIAAFRTALQLRPDYADGWHNLGSILQALDRMEEAVAAYREALRHGPSLVATWFNLANVLRLGRCSEEAIACCRSALALQPGWVDALITLGNVQWDMARFDEAIATFREAIRLAPDSALAYNNLGSTLLEKHDLDGAAKAFRAALQCNPDHADAHSNLGNTDKDRALPEKAVASYRTASELRPESASLHSNLVYAMYFLPGENAGAIRQEQARWNERHAAPHRAGRLAHGNERTPSRRLKIGYVSPDFCTHPVFFFISPLLEAHDRREVEVHGYSCVPRPDAATEVIRHSCDVWRDARGMSDARLAEQIRQDGIDILVDLAMHSADNRLPVFARKPAPVQVSWLAYPGSTGVETMDYRLTDAWMEPDDAAERERPVRLEDTWCCYRPVQDFPEVTELPAWQAGHVTFGALQNFGKVNEDVLRCWSRVLAAVPDARLLLVCPEGSSRARVSEFLRAHDVSAERVSYAARRRMAEHVKDYARIDIGLDPFPCNGMTTTCHALWMGVPVVTLAGRSPMSRAGLSLLSVVGLPELVARSEDEYVAIASELAGDRPRLAALRGGLRERMSDSPLMDAPGFARKVERAYREMWREWCRRAG